MKIFTIGFTKKSAEQFFETLRSSGAKRVVDVRLNNVSQLAGFAKKRDLAYFLEKICGMDYAHLPLLAPTQEMLDRYRKEKGSWAAYEQQFLQLMHERKVEDQVARNTLDYGVLLCSEEKASQCHRRLVAEYFRERLAEVEIVHLG